MAQDPPSEAFDAKQALLDLHREVEAELAERQRTGGEGPLSEAARLYFKIGSILIEFHEVVLLLERKPRLFRELERAAGVEESTGTAWERAMRLPRLRDPDLRAELLGHEERTAAVMEGLWEMDERRRAEEEARAERSLRAKEAADHAAKDRSEEAESKHQELVLAANALQQSKLRNASQLATKLIEDSRFEEYAWDYLRQLLPKLDGVKLRRRSVH